MVFQLCINTSLNVLRGKLLQNGFQSINIITIITIVLYLIISIFLSAPFLLLLPYAGSVPDPAIRVERNLICTVPIAHITPLAEALEHSRSSR